MYIYIHTDYECSQCRALNNYETVNKPIFNGYSTYIRCRSCGHESLESTTTSGSTGTAEPLVYHSPSIPDKVTF